MSKMMPVFAQLQAEIQSPAVSDEVELDSATDLGEESMFNLTQDVFGVIGNTDYHRYEGSLTTPGCNEGIHWHLMANPMYLSTKQLLAFTSMLATEQGGASRGADNRLIQPLNGRVIRTSLPPPYAVTVSGNLQFSVSDNTDAADFTAAASDVIDALGEQVFVPSSSITLGTITDIMPGYVNVPYTMQLPSGVAANTVMSLLASKVLDPSTVDAPGSPLAIAVAAIDELEAVTEVSSDTPVASPTSCAATAFDYLTDAVQALPSENDISSLAAAIQALQANVTTQFAAVATALAARRTPGTVPPGSPPDDTTPQIVPNVPAGAAVYVVATFTLYGYTVATFGSTQSTQFIAVLADSLNLPTSRITITSVVAAAATGRRQLMQGSGVVVTTYISTTAGTAAGSLATALANDAVTTAVLQAGGLSSCTGVSASSPTQQQVVAGAPLPAPASLPATVAEPPLKPAQAGSSSSTSKHNLLGLLALLALPVLGGALGAYFMRAHLIREQQSKRAAAKLAPEFLDDSYSANARPASLNPAA
jgi:hypothetical protein